MTNQTPQPFEERDIGYEYYSYALERIPDLDPFIRLVNQLDELSKEGRINDMRRLLVVEHVRLSELAHRAEQVALIKRVRTEVIGGSTSLNDIYGTDWRNNYGYNETQVRDAANYLQGKQRTALDKLKESLEGDNAIKS